MIHGSCGGRTAESSAPYAVASTVGTPILGKDLLSKALSDKSRKSEVPSPRAVTPSSEIAVQKVVNPSSSFDYDFNEVSGSKKRPRTPKLIAKAVKNFCAVDVDCVTMSRVLEVQKPRKDIHPNCQQTYQNHNLRW